MAGVANGLRRFLQPHYGSLKIICVVLNVMLLAFREESCKNALGGFSNCLSSSRFWQILMGAMEGLEMAVKAHWTSTGRKLNLSFTLAEVKEMLAKTDFYSHMIIIKVFFSFGPLLMLDQNSQMCLGGNHSSLFNYFLSFIWITQWLVGFQFPPPASVKSTSPQTASHRISSYLKCQRLFPITPPHAKPEARATQMEASPLRLLSICFHISLTSVSPPPLCSYCFCPCQGLLCFSFSWPWLHKLLLPLLDSPPCPTTLPGSYPLGALTKPCVLITLWNWSQDYLFPGWGSVEDLVGGRAKEGEARKLLWLNQADGVGGWTVYVLP